MFTHLTHLPHINLHRSHVDPVQTNNFNYPAEPMVEIKSLTARQLMQGPCRESPAKVVHTGLHDHNTDY